MINLVINQARLPALLFHYVNSLNKYEDAHPTDVSSAMWPWIDKIHVVELAPVVVGRVALHYPL